MAPEAITCRDKTGRCYLLACCGPEACQPVLEMYDCFDPMPASQGLPPRDHDARLTWLRGVMEGGESFIVKDGDRVVGHAVLTPDWERKEAEFIIFVSKPYRNRGLGTQLTRRAIARARELGLRRIWLEVESFNFPAVKLYRKCGFQFAGPCECGRKMVLDLDGSS